MKQGLAIGNRVAFFEKIAWRLSPLPRVSNCFTPPRPKRGLRKRNIYLTTGIDGCSVKARGHKKTRNVQNTPCFKACYGCEINPV